MTCALSAIDMTGYQDVSHLETRQYGRPQLSDVPELD